MRWSPNELLRQAQNIFEIKDGDLLFTGTPEGVGPLHPGDQLTLKLGNRLEHHLTIV
jgi:fumarylpyruvate hydrolase